MPLEPFVEINEIHLIICVRQITQGNLDYYIKSEKKNSVFSKCMGDKST